MRSPENKCLLCNINDATQTNSHIIPKFMSKTILGDGNRRRGFIIGTDRLHKAPQIVQDTPKEDYILCPTCESYFSILENIIANKIHNKLWLAEHQGQFQPERHPSGIIINYCNEVDPIIWRLLIYSILWRCSISSSLICNDFKLNPDEEKTLSDILNQFNTIDQEILFNLVNEKRLSFPTIPFLIVSADSFSNRTLNMLFFNPAAQNPYQLVLNDYILIFSFQTSELLPKFQFLVNGNGDVIKIGILPIVIFESIINDIRQFLAEKGTSQLKSEQKVLYKFNSGKS